MATRRAGGAPGEHLRERLRERALSFPETHEDHPWGETVVKVRTKVFVFLGVDGGGGGDGDGEHPPRCSLKLVGSHEAALAVPGAAPTGYGLGRAGWVTLPLAGEGVPPEGVLLDWVEESYRTVAPKRLSALLDGAREALP